MNKGSYFVFVIYSFICNTEIPGGLFNIGVGSRVDSFFYFFLCFLSFCITLVFSIESSGQSKSPGGAVQRTGG